MILSFHIPGPPQNWQRTNEWKGRKLTDAKSREYRRHVQQCARVAIWRLGATWPVDKRYACRIFVAYPDRRERDLDNLEKQIGDALNGIAFDDDSQIDDMHSTRLWEESDPRVEVTISLWPDPPPRIKPKKASPISGQSNTTMHTTKRARKAKSNAQ